MRVNDRIFVFGVNYPFKEINLQFVEHGNYDVVLNKKYEKYLYLIILFSLFIYLITSYFYLILFSHFLPQGFFVFLAMAVYTGVTINYYGKRYGSWRFSWSYIIGWVSVVLTFFSGNGSHLKKRTFKLSTSFVYIFHTQKNKKFTLFKCRVLIHTQLICVFFL